MPAGVALNIAHLRCRDPRVRHRSSTGQSIADTDLLETALGFGKQMIGQEFRDMRLFGPSSRARPTRRSTDRLLAFSGRKV